MYGGLLFLGIGSFRTPGSVLYTSVQPNHIANIPLSCVLVAILSASMSPEALPAFPCSFIFHSLPPLKSSTWATASQGTWTDLVCLMFSGPNTVVRCRFLKKNIVIISLSCSRSFSDHSLFPWKAPPLIPTGLQSIMTFHTVSLPWGHPDPTLSSPRGLFHTFNPACCLHFLKCYFFLLNLFVANF